MKCGLILHYEEKEVKEHL